MIRSSILRACCHRLRHLSAWLHGRRRSLLSLVILLPVVVLVWLSLTPRVVANQTAQAGSEFASLRLPRYLKNPERKLLGPGSSVVFWRTTDDTCGLYTWGEFTVAPEQGAPPHLHYGDEEWFIPTRKGPIRMFSASQSPKTYAIGELPGFNTYGESMASVVIDQDDVFYSPAGRIHYFANENKLPVEGFLNVWAPGFGMRNVFDSFKMASFTFMSRQADADFKEANQRLLLEKTGLWGVPHDLSGRMVGRSDFLATTDRLRPSPSNLGRLQSLIDAGEACYPKGGLRKSSLVAPR
jgi:hypothetical protein